jgi:MFS superfamily sulfate permease-like transporter
VHTDSTLGTLWQLITHIGDAQWRTIALGLILLVVLAVLERFARRLPGALVVLVLGGVAVARLGLASKGVAIIGDVPAGLPGWPCRVSHSGISGR